MKKALLTTSSLAIVLLAAAPVQAAQTAPDISGLYGRTAVITDLDHETDFVTVEAPGRLQYIFCGCEDYSTGDFVSLLMWDNGTPDNVLDDVPLDICYAGYSMDNLVDMQDVVSIDDSGVGVLIITSDGSGYYWER